MQLRTICKGKIHGATVTRSDLDYVGSIGIDAGLMKRADIVSGERVVVWNVSTGARIETYAIPLDEGSGEVVLNGAAARHCQRGDRLIIASFVLTDEAIRPRMFLVDGHNAFSQWLSADDADLGQSQSRSPRFDTPPHDFLEEMGSGSRGPSHSTHGSDEGSQS